MPPRSTNRLEWVSLLYLLFFVLAVLSPSLYRQSFFGISETTLEESTIFLFGMAGILTFTFYERLMERREKEREKVQLDYTRAKTELIESYAYIGSINRKIELLKKLANDTSLTLVDNRRVPKELFQALAANASSVVGAQAALIRIIELSKLRTEREFIHLAESKFTFKVANKDLRELHERQVGHAFLLSEDEKNILVVPADRADGEYKAYLLLYLNGVQIPEIDTTLLKVFVNQAQMLYRNFVGTAGASDLLSSPAIVPQLAEEKKNT